MRVPLLWDDPWASGYDGWYYVLQTRSWMAGEPLFADRSLVFWALSALARLTGSVVVGNKVATCLFAALGSAGMAIGCGRITGSTAAGLVAGLWWACAPGHLYVSFEFLKNEAGLAVLGVLWALLAHASTRRWALVGALLCTAFGLAVHKLTGVFGLCLALGTLGAEAWRRARSQGMAVPSSMIGWTLAVGGALGAVALSIGVLRVEDFARLVAPGPSESSRFITLLTSTRIHPFHRFTLVGAHLLPLLLTAALWHTRKLAAGLPWVALSIAAAAPLLPFGFDLTAWRLLLMAFVPAALALALVVAHAPRWVGAAVGMGVLATLPATVPHAAQPEPNYAQWAEVVPLLQAHVAETERVVAHRGVCGFVWAEADRICENFDPQGSAEGWWRIVYGMGEARLAPYTSQPPVRLMLGYTLVPEAAWRQFRLEHAETLPLVHHPRNPYRARPGFVYGPKGTTPTAGDSR